MQRITAKTGQSFLDIAMQYCGDAALAVNASLLNDTSITQELTAGASYQLPAALVDKQRVVQLLSYPQSIPASIDEVSIAADTPTGIGFMQIGNDFIVS